MKDWPNSTGPSIIIYYMSQFYVKRRTCKILGSSIGNINWCLPDVVPTDGQTDNGQQDDETNDGAGHLQTERRDERD